MHVGMIVEMAADGLFDRVAVGSLRAGVTFAELGARPRLAGTLLAVLLAQMLIGEIQYRNALPWGLVLAHVTLGASIWGVPAASTM